MVPLTLSCNQIALEVVQNVRHEGLRELCMPLSPINLHLPSVCHIKRQDYRCHCVIVYSCCGAAELSLRLCFESLYACKKCRWRKGLSVLSSTGVTVVHSV